jgi:two-component system, sensor histidine kinase and response regulator
MQRGVPSPDPTPTVDPAVDHPTTPAETVDPPDAAAELSRLRAALAAAEQRLADVQGLAGLCTWQSDAGGDDMRFSPAAKHLLGLDATGGPIDAGVIRERIRPEDRALLRADRVRVLAGEPAVTTRFRFRHGDGNWRWLESRVTLLPAQGSQPARTLGTLRDISDVQASQQVLEGHKARLEDLVVSRTVRLAEASERAEAAGRARNSFLAHTSHEIRTPLNAIVSLAHLMQRAENDPVRLGRARAVEHSARHLSALIDDLLDLARDDGDHLAARKGPLSPVEVLDAVSTMLRPLALARGVQLAVDTAQPAEPVRGDAARLRQALLSAGRWALDHTADGTLHLHMQQAADPLGTVVLRMAVDCPTPGLSFDPDGDVELASLRRLSGRMGGSCGIESLGSAGSRCWFTAPLERTDAQVPVQRPSGDQLASQLRERHAGRRVLVAEDDLVNQMVMQELLAEVGLDVDVAEDGQEAIDRAASRPYALVALDLRMPRVGGLDAARAMRQMAALQNTPIVAVTANAFEEDRAACRAVGMNDFLPKPIQVDRLYELLLHWLDRSPTGLQGPSSEAPEAAPVASPLPAPAPSLPAKPSAADPRMASLLGLEGVDALDGLAAVGGRVDVYRRLLGVFVTTHGDDGRTMAALLRDGDGGAAARLAHRLRGSAATLGLVDVETAASALEGAVEEGERGDLVAALGDALADAVDQTTSCLRRALAPAP